MRCWVSTTKIKILCLLYTQLNATMPQNFGNRVHGGYDRSNGVLIFPRQHQCTVGLGYKISFQCPVNILDLALETTDRLEPEVLTRGARLLQTVRSILIEYHTTAT
jgi:hypothetical protein